MNGQAQPGVRGRRRAGRTPLTGGPSLGARRRDGREDRYAGSKWGSAPAAAALPPPPTHWWRAGERCRPEPDRALPLKMILNVA